MATAFDPVYLSNTPGSADTPKSAVDKLNLNLLAIKNSFIALDDADEALQQVNLEMTTRMTDAEAAITTLESDLDALEASVIAHHAAAAPHSGHATLVGGKIPTSQLPAIAITNTFVVNTEAAMLALDAQTGDVAVRMDELKSYILAGSEPTNLVDWQYLPTPGGATVVSVDTRTGAVTLGDLYEALANKGEASGYASLNSSSKVVQDPANATATPTADKIPIAAAGGKLDGWITPDKNAVKVLEFTIDNGASVVASGQADLAYFRFPHAGTINSWSIEADASGSIAIDIWKHASGTIPTSADKITSTTGPALSSAQMILDSTTMTDWTTSVAAGDIFIFHVNGAATTIKRVTVSLKITVTGVSI